MKKNRSISLGILKTTLTLLSFSCCANGANSINLDLTFDEYKTPHAVFLINGHDVDAMIDTGSTLGFHLKESEMKNLKGLKRIKDYLSTDGSGRIQKNTQYLAKRINLSGLIFDDVMITPFKPWGLMVSGKGALPKSSVIGLGAFKEKIITLDYASKSLIISKNIKLDELKESYKEYSFNLTSDGLLFEVKHAGNTYHMILDTGATVSVIWEERLKDYQLVSCLTVDPEMNNNDCTATQLTISSKKGSSIMFGAVIVSGDFKHMDKIDGLIGNNLLKNRSIIIDFKNKKVFINEKE
ncbi:hypothetical protein GKQ23_08210 [Erwinia sp. E602]|uniref:hypothetical protein n=1 Tax=Erwinia sp. E602 TaxID=2675378 RepID=UPI001BAE1619|nr:hypothetical protein [Erwinia sp. E602]QUG74972.1 hypothetical protein GKQ23_08210 [Erwinia sp. E602]